MWMMRMMDSLSLRVVPHNTMVYEVSGPLFFGAADKILKITLDEKMNCLVLRMQQRKRHRRHSHAQSGAVICGL